MGFGHSFATTTRFAILIAARHGTMQPANGMHAEVTFNNVVRFSPSGWQWIRRSHQKFSSGIGNDQLYASGSLIVGMSGSRRVSSTVTVSSTQGCDVRFLTVRDHSTSGSTHIARSILPSSVSRDATGKWSGLRGHSDVSQASRPRMRHSHANFGPGIDHSRRGADAR
jgi:hypothetical protein